MTQTLVLPYPPSTNRLWSVMRGKVVKSLEARNYQNLVKALAEPIGERELITGPVKLSITLYPKKTLKDSGKPPRCIDLSNAVKIVEDALNKVVWLDDSQVVNLQVEKGPPTTNGGIVVSWQA